MTNDEQPPTNAQPSGLMTPGKVSYMQIPATDAFALAPFYEAVFGWQVRRGEGASPAHLSFQDASGELIGAFVTERAVVRDPGVVPYISVSGIDAVIARAREHGAEVVRDVFPEGNLLVADLRDPAGNVIGVWQMGPR